MACATCNNSILFGGIKHGEKKYCNKKCFEADEINRVSASISDHAVELQAVTMHKSKCPQCGEQGPIDLHKSYSIYSVVLYTQWKTHEHVACKSCARKKQKIHLLSSMLFGWWGLPFGLIVTPYIIFMNLFNLTRNPGRYEPSKALIEWSRTMLAAQEMENFKSN